MEVVSVAPAVEEIAASRDAVIEIVFSDELDPASVTAGSFSVHGTSSGVVSGAVEVEGALLRLIPTRALSAGERIAVRATQALVSIGGDPLAAPYTWRFWAAADPSGASFTLTRRLDGGDNPFGIVGADLDGDGALDLAVSNETTGIGDENIIVFLSDGAGSFRARDTYVSGVAPEPLGAVDLNADGALDLLAANANSQTLSVFLGRGDGTFDPGIETPSGASATGLDWIDLDRDGDLDVLIADSGFGGSEVTALTSNGDGTFSGGRSVDPAPDNDEKKIVAEDINGDGLDDLLVGLNNGFSDPPGGVEVFTANPGGGFSRTASLAGSGEAIAVGDLNGDGLADIASTDLQNDVFVFLATAPGEFAEAVILPTGFDPLTTHLALGDVDGDADLDLAIAESNFLASVFTIYTNDGSGAFVATEALSGFDDSREFVLHDLDGDGDLDLSGVDWRQAEVVLFRND